MLAALEAAGDDPATAAQELDNLGSENASLTMGSSDPKALPQLAAVRNTVSKLQFLSAPMDGFTSHLLTQLQGSESQIN